MKTLITACSFLLLLSLSLASCKKDKSSPSDSQLIGEWQEMGLDGINRSLKFKDDQTFHFSIDDKSGDRTVISGTYRTEGNSLEVLAQEMELHQPNQSPIRQSYQNQLYENATFEISKNVLTLNYTSYPADAPFPTTAKFQRQSTEGIE